MGGFNRRIPALTPWSILSGSTSGIVAQWQFVDHLLGVDVQITISFYTRHSEKG